MLITIRDLEGILSAAMPIMRCEQRCQSQLLLMGIKIQIDCFCGADGRALYQMNLHMELEIPEVDGGPWRHSTCWSCAAAAHPPLITRTSVCLPRTNASCSPSPTSRLRGSTDSGGDGAPILQLQPSFPNGTTLAVCMSPLPLPLPAAGCDACASSSTPPHTHSPPPPTPAHTAASGPWPRCCSPKGRTPSWLALTGRAAPRRSRLPLAWKRKLGWEGRPTSPGRVLTGWEVEVGSDLVGRVCICVHWV
jgi:hypothetical protein